MYINLVIPIISIIIGLISIFVGIWIIGRLAGKFRNSVKFLIIAAAIFAVKEALKAFEIFATTNLELVINILNVIIVLFILLAVINMKQMIDGIDNHYKKK